MALGKRIKAEREARGWDQSTLCERVPGLSQQALSNLEQRDSATSIFAIKIADALEVSVRWLLDAQGHKEDRDWPFERISRARWDACTASDRGYVQSAMNAALKECEETRLSGGPKVVRPNFERRAPASDRRHSADGFTQEDRIDKEIAESTTPKKGAPRERHKNR